MSVLNVLAELPRRVFKCDGKWLAFSILFLSLLIHDAMIHV